MFVPLRLHSVYSRGKGSVTIAEALAWLGRRRIPAAALTDVGNVYGWGAWKRAAGAGRTKPLFGCEVELGGGRFVFLVKNGAGYGNLMEIFNRREIRDPGGLVTIYLPEGGGGKAGRAGGPAADAPGKASHPGGEAGLLAGLRDRIPPGDLYLGCDFSNARRVLGAAAGSAGLPFDAAGDARLAGRAGEDRGAAPDPAAGLPIVWANPLKYVASPERLILLHAIEKKIPYPPEREKLAAKTPLFGPDQEALASRRLGPAVKAAFARTFEIAEKCAFAFADVVPPLPPDLFRRSLREIVTERLAAAGRGLSGAERRRARRELAVIEASGFAPYFLVVHDVVEFARRRGILHNLRGSGASSFLAWLLGVSHVNPVAFDLYFERFLNRGRPDPPDIDLDFDSRRRDEVLAYVLETYGSGKTGAAFVCSLKDFGARSALYETLRAFGVPPDEARGHAKRLPFYAEPELLRRDAPASGFLEAWKLAAELQDVYHEISLHVGGVILTPAPAERFLPLETSAKGLRMTHFDKDAVEDLRLIKLDLLSVRGLAAVSETMARLGPGAAIPPGDPRTYETLRSARTIGCFQVESPAMMNLLRRMKPADVFEITQALALVRPGPTESGMKEALLRRRSGRAVPGEPLFRDDGLLRRLLPETGGLLIYEEQVMQVAERVAGMPPETGDLLRRSLKKAGGGPALREAFVREARARGFAPAEVERLWRTLEKFSAYSFNKAHSASYAHMAYRAVYLKTHHPVPYFAAVLNAGGGYYDPSEYVEEAKRNGVRLLQPDANRSGRLFEVEGEAIRVGFGSIKGLAEKSIDRLLEERSAGGEFVSVEDFLSRVKPARAELLSLIKAGIFDILEPRRTRQVLRYFQGLRNMDEVADVAADEKRRMLYDALGFLPEGEVLDLFEGRRPDLRIEDAAACAGRTVELVVRVIDARRRVTYGRGNGRSGDFGAARQGGRVTANDGDRSGGSGGDEDWGEAGPAGAAVGYGTPWGDGDGEESGPSGGGAGGGAPRYFYLFEDETGLLEGVGESRCVTYGAPPVCFLRGEVRRDREGVVKISGCTFLKGF